MMTGRPSRTAAGVGWKVRMTCAHRLCPISELQPKSASKRTLTLRGYICIFELPPVGLLYRQALLLFV